MRSTTITEFNEYTQRGSNRDILIIGGGDHLDDIYRWSYYYPQDNWYGVPSISKGRQVGPNIFNTNIYDNDQDNIPIFVSLCNAKQMKFDIIMFNVSMYLAKSEKLFNKKIGNEFVRHLIYLLKTNGKILIPSAVLEMINTSLEVHRNLTAYLSLMFPERNLMFDYHQDYYPMGYVLFGYKMSCKVNVKSPAAVATISSISEEEYEFKIPFHIIINGTEVNDNTSGPSPWDLLKNSEKVTRQVDVSRQFHGSNRMILVLGSGSDLNDVYRWSKLFPRDVVYGITNKLSSLFCSIFLADLNITSSDNPTKAQMLEQKLKGKTFHMVIFDFSTLKFVGWYYRENFQFVNALLKPGGVFYIPFGLSQMSGNIVHPKDEQHYYDYLKQGFELKRQNNPEIFMFNEGTLPYILILPELRIRYQEITTEFYETYVHPYNLESLGSIFGEAVLIKPDADDQTYYPIALLREIDFVNILTQDNIRSMDGYYDFAKTLHYKVMKNHNGGGTDIYKEKYFKYKTKYLRLKHDV